MDFDLGFTNKSNESNVEKNEELAHNSSNGMNDFINNLINSSDFKIKIDKDLLKDFEKFIEEDFFEIIMNDKIFSEQEQVELVREIDDYKKAFLNLINKPYLNNKLILAITGNFSAGKSSLLNALLNTNLPVNAEATTAIPTYITFYDKLHKGLFGQFKTDGNHMVVSSKCNILGTKEMEKEFLNFITKENVKNFPIPLSKVIDYFVLSIKNNNILQNKVIIDTPGINPPDKKKNDFDENITKNSLVLANVVFWVMDIDNGDLTSDSIKFLKENISENQDLVVIINKVDEKSPKDIRKVLDKVKDTLAKHIKKSKSKKVLTFSREDRNLINSVASYITNLSVEDTTPEVITLVEMKLEEARRIVVDKIIEERDNLNYYKDLNKDIIADDYETLLKKYKNKDGESTIEGIKQIFEKDFDEYQNKYDELFNLIKYDDPFLGNPHYYFYEEEYNNFKNKVNDIVNCFSLYERELGYWIGVIEKLNIEMKNNIEELESLETKINKAINKFENLKYDLKKI